MLRPLVPRTTENQFREVTRAADQARDGQERRWCPSTPRSSIEVQKDLPRSPTIWGRILGLANTRRSTRMANDLQEIVARNIKPSQHSISGKETSLNDSLPGRPREERGLSSTSGIGSFRAALTKAKFYAEWREKFGKGSLADPRELFG